MIVDMVIKGVVGFDEFLKNKLVERPNDHFDIYIKNKYGNKFYSEHLHEIALKMLSGAISTFFNNDNG